ncbi:MAG: hypothetical protein EP343_33440 [Deltaproteobacteria bacterium]|nr:MAG: hypothetical protein EP343_33440 [Deltaproteobacteria bacterium]
MSYHLIIPAAGQGLRAYPFTGFGTTPKPFVAMGSKTVFDYIMEEALASDVSSLSLIVSERSGGAAVYERYFDPFRDNPSLRETLGKKLPEVLPAIDAVSGLEVDYVDQVEPLGFGHAVGLAWPSIDASSCEGVLVALGDDLVCGSFPGMKQLVEVHKQVGGMVFMVDEVTREGAKRFGVAQLGKTLEVEGSCREAFEVTEVVEKPQDPKPNVINGEERYFAVVGRYLLEVEDLKFLAEQNPTPGKELDFTPLFARKVEQGRLTAILPDGRFCTVGNSTDLQKSNIRFALEPFRQGGRADLVQETLDALIDVGALTYKEGSWHIDPTLKTPAVSNDK